MILAIGTIIVGLFIQEGAYGLYAIALIPANTLFIFHDWGISSALTRYCAQYRGQNRDGELQNIIKAGLIFKFITGIILTLVSVLSANFIASAIFGKPEITFLVIVASMMILPSSLLNGAQSVLLGFDKMKLYGLTTISQAFIQSVLSPLLVFIGYGALGVILGYTVSTVVATLLTLILLYFTIIKKVPNTKSAVYETLKQLLRYGVPLGISVTLISIITQFYSFVIATSVSEVIMGNYRMALNFVLFLSFFTLPIAQVLLPMFSKLDPQKDHQVLKSVFRFSVKYTVLFLLPAAMAVIIMSQQFISTVYGAKWLYAPFFLSLLSIVYLFEVFGSMSVVNFLSAMGETKILLKIQLLVIVIGVPLALLLIPQFGIPAVVFVDIVDTFPGLLILLYKARKSYNVTIDFMASAKIFFASLFAGAVTYAFLSFFIAPAPVMLTAGTLIFLLTYLICAPLFRAIDKTDLSNLRSMFSGLGLVSKALEIPLTIMEKSMKIQISDSSTKQ